ncbi:unnamed protein product, partial [Closterium sp. NIES-53]
SHAQALRDALAQSQSNNDRLADILGSFDQRLSALDTAMRPTQERTYAIRKAHVNVDKALKAAEVVLEKYDVARQVEERIKEGPKNALDPYLAAIARLHEGVAYFEANRKDADPAKLLDASKQGEEEGGAEGEKEGGGLPVLLADPTPRVGAHPQRPRQQLPVLLAGGKVGERTRQLAAHSPQLIQLPPSSHLPHSRPCSLFPPTPSPFSPLPSSPTAR